MMKNFREVLAGSTAVLSLVLVFSTVASSTTPKEDPFSSCASPAADFSVTIGFDSTNQVPTVSATKNSFCVAAGNAVTFQPTAGENITSWQVNFPTVTPVFTGTCTFGTKTSGSSQSCTVATNAGEGDYVYQVQVWIGSGTTPYTLDPKVIIQATGRKRKKREHREAADQP
jgi:hypothetical protein